MKQPDPDLDVGSFGVFCSQDIFVSLVPSPQNDLLYIIGCITGYGIGILLGV